MSRKGQGAGIAPEPVKCASLWRGIGAVDRIRIADLCAVGASPTLVHSIFNADMRRIEVAAHHKMRCYLSARAAGVFAKNNSSNLTTAMNGTLLRGRFIHERLNAKSAVSTGHSSPPPELLRLANKGNHGACNSNERKK